MPDAVISPHPAAHRFDPVIHEPMRLRICGMLSVTEDLSFATIRDTLGINDAACSKHLKTLIDCGYVVVDKRKAADSEHLVRWYAMTSSGHTAFDAHIAELKRIAAGIAS